jgi:hypothetical protein
MSIPIQLTNLTGKWSGINRLHLPWVTDNPIHESKSEALIAFSAQGKFFKIEYDWSFENKPQDGMILLGGETDAELIKVFWVDSWHMGEKFMISEGVINDNNIISCTGFYTVPDHPDWGWRTEIESTSNDSLKITMFNITPEGEESLAVEIEYRRK